MKIAVIGAGFTGLSATLKLTEKKHSVVLFEKEKTAGGLAGTFSLPGWTWHLEKHYHHWFANDYYAFDLIKKSGLKKYLVFPKTVTSIFYQDKSYPFNSALDVLRFSPLSISQRLRTGVILLYLKLLPMSFAVSLEQFPASQWLEKYFGKKAYQILWEPLLTGKFGKFAKDVNMAWFWARIKKRTPRLVYLEGGYHRLVEAVLTEIKERGGKIRFNTSFDVRQKNDFDKIIVTTPSATTLPHLHAYNLLLVTRKKILPRDYWLNINDRSFPFIAIVAQTNLIESKYYSNQHITWVANYLPPDHPYLKMDKEELLKLYLPYLKRINPNFSYQLSVISYQLFKGPYAQPVFPVNYSKIKPNFQTPIPNVYLANMDMVYPWDRGTNYAIELGYRVAEFVTS